MATRRLGIPGGRLTNVHVEGDNMSTDASTSLLNLHSSPEMYKQQLQNRQERRLRELEKKVGTGW